jgi:hypothetical protein
MNSAEPSSWSQTPKSRSFAPRGADESKVGRTEQNRDCVGAAVRRADGRAEGLLVGLAEGLLVGRLVGFLVGCLDGLGGAAVANQRGRTSTWKIVIKFIFYGRGIKMVSNIKITSAVGTSQSNHQEK